MSELRQRKYTILPGVSTPNFEEILAATSDYSEPGEIEIHLHREVAKETASSTVVSNITSADIAELQRLGDAVSEEEARSIIESKRKMDAIKNSAVLAPQSMDSLMKAAAEAEVDEEKRAQIEAERVAREKAAAEAEAKKREIEAARAERKAQQDKAFEEFLAGKAENPQPIPVKKVEEEVSTEENKAEETVEAVFTEIEEIDSEVEEIEVASIEEIVKEPIVVEDATTVSLIDDSDSTRMLSDEETLDDFSDFL